MALLIKVGIWWIWQKYSWEPYPEQGKRKYGKIYCGYPVSSMAPVVLGEYLP
jgi:hypothetical protein